MHPTRHFYFRNTKMIQTIKPTVATLALLALCACDGLRDGFRSALPALDRGGPHSLADDSYNPEAAGSLTGNDRAFAASFKLALADQLTKSEGLTTVPEADVSRNARQAAIDGMSVASNNCHAFFDNLGVSQKWLWFGKDTIAAAGAVATGAILLASPANATAGAVVALASSTSYASVDIYARNFLFGAENIDQVRTLVINAMAEHRKVVLTPVADPKTEKPWSFPDVIDVVQDHQLLCRPARIKLMVLDAVKKGTVAAFTPNGQRVVATADVTPKTGTIAPAPLAKSTESTLAPITPNTAAAAGSRHFDMQVVK